MLKINKKRIKENIEKIKSKYLMVLSFIIANLINGILLRGVTVGEPFRIQPLFIDFGLLILISLLFIPLILAGNLIAGFTFVNIRLYQISIFYPLCFVLTYFVYYFARKFILKSKNLY